MKRIIFSGLLVCALGVQAFDRCLVLNRSQQDWRFNIRRFNSSNELITLTHKAGVLSAAPLLVEDEGEIWPTFGTCWSPFLRWTQRKPRGKLYIIESDSTRSAGVTSDYMREIKPGANTYVLDNMLNCEITLTSSGEKADSRSLSLQKNEQITIDSNPSTKRPFIYTKSDSTSITVIYRDQERNCTSYELFK